ncbi:MAG: hypothetical protein ACPGWR_07895 [Ardenticatenaceae bacterium]
MVINIKTEKTPSQMMGRLFDIEKIPILKMRREWGNWDGPSALEFTLGNNYIYVGSEHKNLSLPASPLAANGKNPPEYRRWLWGRICAKDQAIGGSLGEVTLSTSIAYWPEDDDIAVIVQKAADWVWSQKKTPNVPSDLDYSGQFGQSDLGWDGVRNYAP